MIAIVSGCRRSGLVLVPGPVPTTRHAVVVVVVNFQFNCNSGSSCQCVIVAGCNLARASPRNDRSDTFIFQCFTEAKSRGFGIDEPGCGCECFFWREWFCAEQPCDQVHGRTWCHRRRRRYRVRRRFLAGGHRNCGRRSDGRRRHHQYGVQQDGGEQQHVDDQQLNDAGHCNDCHRG